MGRITLPPGKDFGACMMPTRAKNTEYTNGINSRVLYTRVTGLTGHEIQFRVGVTSGSLTTVHTETLTAEIRTIDFHWILAPNDIYEVSSASAITIAIWQETDLE